jgi:hypothetical protein
MFSIFCFRAGPQYTKFHLLCNFSEFQKKVVPASAGTPSKPVGSDMWTDEQKLAFIALHPDPSEIVTKYAVRCAVISSISDAELTAVAGKLRWCLAAPPTLPFLPVVCGGDRSATVDESPLLVRRCARRLCPF